MAYVIHKVEENREMWLRTDSPAVTWGPREHAKVYVSDRLARTALLGLPARHRQNSRIVRADP
jgi:hypothetical protein